MVSQKLQERNLPKLLVDAQKKVNSVEQRREAPLYPEDVSTEDIVKIQIGWLVDIEKLVFIEKIIIQL